MAGEENSSTNVRITRLEEDGKDMRADLKELNKSVTNIEKSIIQSTATQEKILMMISDNKVTLEESVRRSIKTENLALNLVTVTDGLVKDLEAVTLKVIAIEEKPSKNYEKLKWVLISFIVSNLFGLMGIIYKVMSANK